MLILGQGALRRADGMAVLAAARELAERFGLVKEGWNGFNVLHTAAARVGGLDLGLVPGKGGLDVAGMLQAAGKGALEVLFLLGADELDLDGIGDAFVIYQGHHGDRGARRADVILPGAAYTEKNATYVNTEGRPQRARLAVFPPGEAREDWKILRALSEALGRKLPLDTLGQVRARMVEIAPQLAEPDVIQPAPWRAFGRKGKLDGAPFASPIVDFYRTDPISRASLIMAECSALHSSGPRARDRHPWLSFWTGYAWPTIWIVMQIVVVIVPLLLAVAYLTYAERKVIAAMQLRQGPMVVGPLGLLAADRRRPEAPGQGDRDPERRQQGRVHRRADDHLRAGADRLGGDPVRRRPRDRRHQRRRALPVRDLARSASTASSWPAGPATRATPSSARCARPPRWSPTRSRSA